jgi:hypothetical protein
MYPIDFKPDYKFVQDRYNYLKITLSQAKEIFQFERDKNAYSENEYFSVWEEWDYDYSCMKDILSPIQLKKYSIFREKNIKRHESFIKNDDKKKIKDIKYYNELISYITNKYLLDYSKIALFVQMGLFREQDKIKLIKAEYLKFLEETKKSLIVNHIRQRRIFCPNELKATMLRHGMWTLIPEYGYFKRKMDEPTKAIAKYLVQRLSHISKERFDVIHKKNKELESFRKRLFKKYFDEVKGWHTFAVKLSSEEEFEAFIMTHLITSTLLADKPLTGTS